MNVLNTTCPLHLSLIIFYMQSIIKYQCPGYDLTHGLSLAP